MPSPYIEGWLYLLRPALALPIVLFAYTLWRIDRRQARERRRTQAMRALPAAAARMRWRLEVESRVYFVDDTVTIGRSPDCTIVLSDGAVSALHAVVVRSAGGTPWLEDLSRNGTLLRGQRLSAPTLLDDGDDIEIGDVHLRVARSAADEP